jgi:hypothetical protein
VGGQHHALAALPPGKDLGPIVQEAGWAPGPVCTCAKNLAPPGFNPQTIQPVVSRLPTEIPGPQIAVTTLICSLRLNVCDNGNKKHDLFSL